MQASFLSTIADSRVTYVVVMLVGMAMCTRGIAITAAKGLWANPISIAGYLLGAVALLLGLQGIFRFTLVPLHGWLLLGGILAIIVLKMVLALGYRTA
jgi:hypothetical protein